MLCGISRDTGEGIYMTDPNCGFLTRTNFDNSLTITNNVDLKEKNFKAKIVTQKRS